MKTTLKIARAELALLFYSPIAWFLLVAFLFQCGLAYTNAIDYYLTQQDMGGEGLKYLTFLTSRIFAPPYGIWPSLAGKLYLYLPLLTMGLMSREISSGTIKLMYSSPIKVKEIVFGKFIAMMGYNLVLVLVLAVVVIIGIFNIHAADAGMLFTGLLGMYLLLCTYASIGLFMSCLTSYQVVAALSTLVLLATLSYIGTVFQDIDFVRDLTYFLSINGRADNMLLGLITTKDVLYFCVITAVFLSFSIYKLQSDRESRPAWVKISRYVLIFFGMLAIGYLTSRPGFIGYADNTSTKTMTLAAAGQKILKETGEDPIEVTSYINLLDNRFWYGRPDQRNQDMARWEQYLRFKPDIKFNYVYFYESTGDKNLFKYNPGNTLRTLAERYAKSMKLDLSKFKSPEEIRKIVDLRPEQNRYVMQLKYKGQSTFLRLFDDQLVFPTETETGAALKRLMQAKIPKIAFVQDDLERSIDKIGDRHYKMLTNEITFRFSLINQGFDPLPLYLKTQEIPSDITALVIADPKVMLDSISLKKIRRYIDEGGNLLIAGEPGKQEILNPLLQPLGVEMMEGMLVQPDKNFSAELIRPWATPAAGTFTRNLKQDIEDSLCVSMRAAAALTYRKDGPFSIQPLVMTDPASTWNKRIKPDQDMIEASEEQTGSYGAGGGVVAIAVATGSDVSVDLQDGKKAKAGGLHGIVYSPEQGDQKGAMPVVLGLTRKINGRQQRIIIAGDADFLSNAELSRNNIKTSNFNLSTGIFSWFSNGEFPIDSFRPPSADRSLTLSGEGLNMLNVFLLGVLPGIMLVAGSVILIRRKRK